MTYVSYAIGVLGLVGVYFGVASYWHLRRWARQMQGARIAISYKRKVKLQAPLQEWMLWCNQLDKDKQSGGRVVYTLGGTSVAIIKRPEKAKPGNAQIKHKTRQGTWTAKDETVKS